VVAKAAIAKINAHVRKCARLIAILLYDGRATLVTRRIMMIVSRGEAAIEA
jgi:hypothetical protein